MRRERRGRNALPRSLDGPPPAGLTMAMAFTLGLDQPAPDFDLPGTDGKRHSLHSFDGCRVLVPWLHRRDVPWSVVVNPLSPEQVALQWRL